MGLHTIQFTWNILVKEYHQVTVTRIGHPWTDTLEVALDGKTIVSRTVGPIQGMGISGGQQRLYVDGCQIEMRWKYNGSTNDPDSIVLIRDNKIIAQYGTQRAAKSIPIAADANPANFISLTEPPVVLRSQYVGRSWLRKRWFRLTNRFGSPTVPPMSMSRKSEIDLQAIGRELGMQDSGLIEDLAIHSKHLRKWRQFTMVIYWGLGILVYLGLGWLFSYVANRSSWTLDYQYYLFLPLVSYLLFGLVGLMILKIAYGLASKLEIETLCAATILYILMELSENDVLIHPDKKEILLARMNYLARQTRQLARRYRHKGVGLINMKWIEQHFNAIELDIREHQRWICTPMVSTLQDLRRDLYSLAPIYITGLYGEFTYQPPSAVEAKEVPTLPPVRARLLLMLQKAAIVVLGLVLPIVLLILIAKSEAGNQKIFGFLEPKFATTLVLTWFSIALSKILNVDGGLDQYSQAKEIVQT